jgi:hypothetical protein
MLIQRLLLLEVALLKTSMVQNTGDKNNAYLLQQRSHAFSDHKTTWAFEIKRARRSKQTFLLCSSHGCDFDRHKSVAANFYKEIHHVAREQVYEISIILFVFCITNDSARRQKSKRRARAGRKFAGKNLSF